MTNMYAVSDTVKSWQSLDHMGDTTEECTPTTFFVVLTIVAVATCLFVLFISMADGSSSVAGQSLAL